MTTAFTATADQIGYYLVQARDTAADIIAVLLKSGGESDGALADRATLADVKLGSTEADFTNYARLTMGSPSRTVDGAGDRVLLKVGSPFTWSAAGGAVNNTLARILYCYLPSAGAADTAILPLMSADIAATTNGNDLQITVHADGFAVVTA